MALGMNVVSTGSTISCHGVQYVIKTGGRCRKKEEKEILKGITGVFEPGMNAILGPTGGGKTSLLDILAGRKDKNCVRGKVLIDGNDLPSNFKCLSGYVVQDDVVMGTLTVRENLAFSAALRLPGNISAKEKRNRVDDIINELSLNDCKDTKVGTELLRGVSGGERKRTNIGMELIIKPSVLFLDEPTTGLDASTSYSVMSLLALLSKRGRTIIFSIHQPRYTIFRLFDTLHLLSKGETVYHGRAQDTLDYFSSIGYECEAHNNPPDFFLDVIIGNNAPVMSTTNQNNTTNQNDTTNENDATTEMIQIDAEEGKSTPAAKETTSNRVSIVKQFKESSHFTDLEDKASKILKLHESKDPTVLSSVSNAGYPTGFLTQLHLISKRAFLNFTRNLQVSLFQPILTVLFAIFIGLLYSDSDDSFPAGTQNRTGALFFACIFMMFSNIAATELFLHERRIFIHESSSGYYRTSSYFLGKLFFDLLPMRIIPTVLFVCIYYWIIGFRADAASFFIFILTLVLLTLCGTGIVYFNAITFGITGIVNVTITCCNLVQVIFGGLFVNVLTIPAWLSWLKYLSSVRYALNALLITEFRGRMFCRHNSTVCITGEMYLEDFGIDRYDTWGLWLNHVALACIMISLFILSYVQLRRIPKYK